MNKLENYFFNKRHTLQLSKWHHYFEIYDKHFSRFQGHNPNILEIGVWNGGGLEMWNDYFDGKCQIYGVDIMPSALEIPKKLGLNNVKIDLGDQENRNFWKEYLKDKPKFDIVIDDGGHTMGQQIVTYEEIYDYVKDDGVYVCEDLHTSYWTDWGGSLGNRNTFIEYTKNFIDFMHFDHIIHDNRASNIKFIETSEAEKFRRNTKSIHYYDSIIVLEKGNNPAPKTSIK